jgi:hypothetical protein
MQRYHKELPVIPDLIRYLVGQRYEISGGFRIESGMTNEIHFTKPYELKGTIY